MSIDLETPIGRVAAEIPAAIDLFEEHGIDYCCGGERSLAEACTAAGADPAAVAARLQALADRPPTDEQTDLAGWAEAPIADLVDHILRRYHRPLDTLLPRIRERADRVRKAHREHDPDTIDRLHRAAGALVADLEQHMLKEERVLFPMIAQGMGAMADGPVAQMRHEHDEAAGLLRELREVSGGYAAPSWACATMRGLYDDLQRLERDLHEHIHLENNVLFSRILG